MAVELLDQKMPIRGANQRCRGRMCEIVGWGFARFRAQSYVSVPVRVSPQPRGTSSFRTFARHITTTNRREGDQP